MSVTRTNSKVVKMEWVSPVKTLILGKIANWPSTETLSVAAIALFALKLLVSSPGFFGIAIVGLATGVAWFQFRHLKGHWRWLGRFLILAGAACLSAMWLTTFVEPAQAQFFFQAEKFFEEKLLKTLKGGGAGIGTTTVQIIFAAMRALYILYLAVAVIGVVNAVRQDEDWQTAARTPLLIFVVVTAADMLTSFIVGQQF